MFYLVDSFERYKNSRYRQRYDRVNVHVFYLREFSLRQNWRASPPPPKDTIKKIWGCQRTAVKEIDWISVRTIPEYAQKRKKYTEPYFHNNTI